MPPAGQLASVQALRAIAASFVVLFHATVLWHDKFDPSAWLWANGNAGVDLFFVISGFIMVVSSRRLAGLADGWRRFLVLRLVRIVPLYWLITASKLAAIAVFPAMAIHTHPTPFNIAASFLFIPSRDAAGLIRPVLDVGWTLSFELLFYGVFACALFLRVRAALVVVPVMGALAAASWLVRPQWPTIVSLADPIVLEFVFGLLIGSAFLHRREGQGRFGWLCLLAASLAVLASVPTDGRWARVTIWGLAASAALTASVITEARTRRFIPRGLVYLGEASYSLYLTHGFVLPLSAALAARTALRGNALHALVLVGATGGSVAVSLAVFRLIETPVTRWLRRVVHDDGRTGLAAQQAPL